MFMRRRGQTSLFFVHWSRRRTEDDAGSDDELTADIDWLAPPRTGEDEHQAKRTDGPAKKPVAPLLPV
jgi:hypothetical protein